MAISPTIPTSFVPKQPLETQRRKMQPGDNLLLLGSLLIFGASLVTAGAVFGYQQYLNSVIEYKGTQLVAYEAEISSDVVETYIRLDKRFTSSRTLLDNHVALSYFFEELEKTTLKNVRFNGLIIDVAEDRTAKVTLDGVARNFNTLAAQSNEVADNPMFKRAIFADIGPNEDGTIGFSLTSELERGSIILAMPSATEPAAPVEEEAAVEPVSTGTTTAPAFAPAPAAPAPATTTPGL